MAPSAYPGSAAKSLAKRKYPGGKALAPPVSAGANVAEGSREIRKVRISSYHPSL
jgi:hypothetical protein